jgi:small-conductance mechanosensitive channel
MKKRIILLIAFVLASALFWFANSRYPHVHLQRGFWTFIAFAVVYFLFALVFQEAGIKRIKTPKTRYSFKKTISILNLVVFLMVVVTIWVENIQGLLVAYGLIGAGVAIALQDFFKNLLGGIIIFVTGIYRVGDRIEISSKYGDVIDIGLLYTTLMEIKEWVAGDLPTGRLTTIPNGYVISNTINNFTKDHNFIWDEINVPITYDSDWKEAVTVIQGIVSRETKNVTDQAEKELSSLEEEYYFSKQAVEPSIFLTLTDNWITFNIRYITEVRQRRLLHNKLSRMILNEIQKSKNIKIASTTLNIVGFPATKAKQEREGS